MFEAFKKDDRVIFSPSKQSAFLRKVEKYLSTPEMARVCGCSERTIRDWRREKFRMSVFAVHALVEKTGIPMPRTLKIVSAYAHTTQAGKKGGSALIAKYGRVPVTEAVRKKSWETWWLTKGRHKKQPLLQAKPITTPKRSSDLAEFVGIMIGDGGISKYQITITLHSVTDYEFSKYVVQNIERLFSVTPSVYKRPDKLALVILVSRIDLVTYLYSLGLPIGNKNLQHIDIPDWIQRNSKYARACIRGLVDTDGSIFTHTYSVKGKKYRYKKLSFTTASPNLQKSVAHILFENGLSPRISGRDVRLDSKADMKKYFVVFGTSNPKHWKRFVSEVG